MKEIPIALVRKLITVRLDIIENEVVTYDNNDVSFYDGAKQELLSLQENLTDENLHRYFNIR